MKNLKQKLIAATLVALGCISINCFAKPNNVTVFSSIDNMDHVDYGTFQTVISLHQVSIQNVTDHDISYQVIYITCADGLGFCTRKDKTVLLHAGQPWQETAFNYHRMQFNHYGKIVTSAITQVTGEGIAQHSSFARAIVS